MCLLAGTVEYLFGIASGTAQHAVSSSLLYIRAQNAEATACGLTYYAGTSACKDLGGNDHSYVT
jgi:hypothetical protein